MSKARRSSTSKGSTAKDRELQWPLDCSQECRLPQHANLVLSCVALGNLRLLQHCSTVCGNPFRIVDRFGRNALHIAASRGHSDIVEWLAARQKVAVDVMDLESHWSALHRSIYYGQLGTAVLLAKSGSNLTLKDYDGMSPLMILNQDSLCLSEQPVVSAVTLYTWGHNSNVTLGHDHTRSHPERLDLGDRHIVTQVILCKFHSVFLTEEGKVLTCGHGRGGRLGHGSETSVVAPCVVEALSGTNCKAIAAARDHTVVLNNSGVVYTFGLNDTYQLGQPNAQGCVSSPKPVRALKNKRVVSVGTGRYHTAVCTATEVYTFGKNLGQLGYERSSEMQALPRAVPTVCLDRSGVEDCIEHLSVSDAATACLTKSRRIFVCTDYIVKTFRCGFLEKLSCKQFTVCASLSDLDHLRKKETEPTKVLLLDSEHKVWHWEPMKKGSAPSLLPGLAKHRVTQFSLGKSLTVVTEQGEVYSGPCTAGKPVLLDRVAMVQAARAVFTDFKAINFAYLQNEYRSSFVPHVSVGSFRSDLSSLLDEACLPGSVSDIEIEAEGRVFCVHKFILTSASPVLSSILQPSKSNFRIKNLPECIQSLTKHRLVLNSTPNIVEAFLRYLYGSHIRINPPPPEANGSLPSSLSPPPTSPIPTSTSANSTFTQESTPDTSITSIDDIDLSAEYDRYASDVTPKDSWASDSQELPPAIGQSTPKKHFRKRRQQMGGVRHSHMEGEEGEAIWTLPSISLGGDLQALLKLATAFQITSLKSSLETVLFHSTQQLHNSAVLLSPKPSLSRASGSQISDLILTPTQGKPLPCHRCVLVARSEYFRSMLLMGWRESSGSVKSLRLPVSHKVLSVMIDYMYTDEAPSIRGSDSVEWISSVLVVADQLLMSRLKLLCEKALAKTLTLRSVCETLEFAVAYSADQLKKACLQFMSVNASSLLEGRFLEGLDSSLFGDLSASYQEMVPAISKRVIKFTEPDSSDLPESYFMDDDIFSASGSDLEQYDSTLTLTPSREEAESQFRSPAHRDTKAHSSRRKRKRKSSESKKNAQHVSGSPYSPPISPIEMNGHSHSVCNHSSLCSSPEPVEAVPMGTERNTSGVSRGTGSTPKSTQEAAKPHPQTMRGKPQKLSNKFAQSSPGSDIALSSPEKKSISKESGLSNGAGFQANKGQRNISALSSPWNSDNKSPPPLKTAWSKTPNSCNGSSSLREIMAEEEKNVVNRPPQQTKTKKTSPTKSKSSATTQLVRQSSQPHPHTHSEKTSPQTISSHQRQSSRDSPTSPPSAAQSPPSNPWKTNTLSTSPVSMRELIAEATAEEKRREEEAATVIANRRLSDERPRHKQLQVIPHRKVSFAEIIQSQEHEQESLKRAAKKPLTLIQIEQQAIEELKELYKARDNPDEYITVERFHSTGRRKPSSSKHSKPHWKR